MRIVAGILCKNGAWCLRATLPAALEWVDNVVFLDDHSTDDTRQIALSFTNVDYYLAHEHGEFWTEMQLRQDMFDKAITRYPDMTHFALIDDDEMLPIPFRASIRDFAALQKPDTCICPHALNPWNSLDFMRVDRCVWTTNFWSALIKIGNVPLRWHQPGYDHHHRVPNGIKEVRLMGKVEDIGVIHLQFAALNRRKAKHIWYRMTETIRWGGIRPESSPAALNTKYGRAFDETGLKLAPTPSTWFREAEKANIDVEGAGWYHKANKLLLEKYGKERFKGLDINWEELE